MLVSAFFLDVYWLGEGCQTFCSRFGFKWFKNQEAIKPMTVNPMKKYEA